MIARPQAKSHFVIERSDLARWLAAAFIAGATLGIALNLAAR
jgi:hypothetical protein